MNVERIHSVQYCSGRKQKLLTCVCLFSFTFDELRLVGGSPICWKIQDDILARELSDPTSLNVHYLTVDANALKKNGSRNTTKEKRDFVDHQWKEIGSVKKTCENVDLPMSTYHHKPRQTTAEHLYRDADLQNQIELFIAEFPGYSYRRVTKALGRNGFIEKSLFTTKITWLFI